MKTGWIGLLALLAPFALLAGCTSCVEGPPVTARGIAGEDSRAGLSGFALDILVTDGPGGPPLPDAGVVVYYGGTDASDWSGPRIEIREDVVVVDPVNASGTVESKTTLRMSTDEAGRAVARVPANRIVGVVAAKDGYTEEWIPALAAGDGARGGMLTLPLYRAQAFVDVDAVWAGPGAASTGAATSSRYAWDPHEVPFGATTDANRGYAARIVELRVKVEWSNGATAAGDLGIGAGPPSDGPRYFSDGSHNTALGAQSETAVVSLQELREHGILGSPAVMAGAASKSGFVAPFGLPYTMRVEALFDTARANLAACNFGAMVDDNAGAGATVPGQGTIAAILSILGAALLVRVGRR